MTTFSPRKLLVPLVAAGLVFAACGSDDDDGDAAPAPTDAAPGDTSGSANGGGGSGGDGSGGDGSGGDGDGDIEGPEIRLRAQDFSESITITEVYGQFLEARGYDVEILTPAGFRTEALDGLANDDFDLIIDYIGGTQAALAPEEPASADPDEIMPVITPLLADAGATILDYSPAVDGDALVVRGDSEATTISDLVGLDYVLGASAQCPERPQCLIGFEDPDIYGITFADFVTIEFGPLLGEALGASEVDVVMWNTTAPQITEQGFKVLEDDKGLFPAQNIAPIIDTELLEHYGDDLVAALNEISAMITTEDLLAWNVATDLELRESDDVAEEWLVSKGIDD